MNLAVKILQRDECKQVLSSLKGRKGKNAQLNLMVVRLALCCGLRRRELIGVDLGDFQPVGPRPILHVRKEIAKRKKERWVPLWWDSGTLEDIKAWLDFRYSMGAGPHDPFLCSVGKASIGKRLTYLSPYDKWHTAMKVLGEERAKQLHLHCGRHSFASHYAFIGRSLPEIRDALGHSDITTTSIYTHLLVREDVKDGFDLEA